MEAVEWTGLSVLIGVFVACIGYFSRQLSRVEDGVRAELSAVEQRLRADIVPRLDRLEERYVRHLEAHTSH